MFLCSGLTKQYGITRMIMGCGKLANFWRYVAPTAVSLGVKRLVVFRIGSDSKELHTSLNGAILPGWENLG